MKRYSKFWAALLAGLAVTIPVLVAASQDNNISLQEWLAALGALVPAFAAALAPANALTTGDLVDQINKNPEVTLTGVQANKHATDRIEDAITRDPNVRRVV
jgi:hypothetical protein